MGLSIDLLAVSDPYRFKELKKEVARINEALEEENLPTYNGPNLWQQGIDAPGMDWLYSESEPLEFLAAKFIENPSWIPPINRQDYSIISGISYHKIIQERKSHIVGMPNTFGYYVPVYFDFPLWHKCPMLGSSIALRDELQCLAIKLNLDLGEYTPDFGVLRAKREQELEKDAFGLEKWTLLCLYNLAIASIRYDSIIVFSG